MMPLTTIISSVAGIILLPLESYLRVSYLIQLDSQFFWCRYEPQIYIFTTVLVPTEKSAKQIDDESCRVFYLAFLDNIIRGLPILGRITQSIINKLKQDYAFDIFLNSTDLAEVVESEQFSILKCSWYCREALVLMNMFGIEIFYFLID